MKVNWQEINEKERMQGHYWAVVREVETYGGYDDHFNWVSNDIPTGKIHHWVALLYITNVDPFTGKFQELHISNLCKECGDYSNRDKHKSVILISPFILPTRKCKPANGNWQSVFETDFFKGDLYYSYIKYQSHKLAIDENGDPYFIPTGIYKNYTALALIEDGCYNTIGPRSPCSPLFYPLIPMNISDQEDDDHNGNGTDEDTIIDVVRLVFPKCPIPKVQKG